MVQSRFEHVSDTWATQDAKNRFSEVVRRAKTEGPQFVTKHGETEAVVISFEEYQNKYKKPSRTLLEIFKDSPLYGSDIIIERDQDLGRDIDL